MIKNQANLVKIIKKIANKSLLGLAKIEFLA